MGVGHMQFDIPGVHGLDQCFYGLAVGKQGIDLIDAAQSDHGVASELGMVGRQKHLA